MKNFSICDDILVDRVSKELAHFGCFVPISEIERIAIQSYDNCEIIYAESNKTTPQLNALVKDERYYIVLTGFICLEILAETRLSKARNKYEAAGILSILQGYLDKIAKAAGTPRQKAPLVFNDMLHKLPFKMNISTSGIGWSSDLSPAGEQDEPIVTHTEPVWGPLPHINIQTPPIVTRENKSVVEFACSDYNPNTHVCSNKLIGGPFKQCDCENGCNEECVDCVNVTIEHRGLCFGFKVDPVILSIDKPLTSSRSDLESRTKVFKNFLNKANKEFKDNLVLIYTLLCTHHERTEEG